MGKPPKKIIGNYILKMVAVNKSKTILAFLNRSKTRSRAQTTNQPGGVRTGLFFLDPLAPRAQSAYLLCEGKKSQK